MITCFDANAVAKKDQFVMAIDASNLKVGGGVTHLVELLKNTNLEESSFSKIIVWGGERIINALSDVGNVELSHQPQVDKGALSRLYWHKKIMPRLLQENGCNVLYAPGGSHYTHFHPYVTMSRNLLPFEFEELFRYGFSRMTLKLILLRFMQKKAFKKADGLIFLTNYAQKTVSNTVQLAKDKYCIIPHGVNEYFLRSPRVQNPPEYYSFENPYQLLYVSQIEPYKHHLPLMEAVSLLRKQGLPLVLNIVGASYSRVRLNQFLESKSRVDPENTFIFYHQSVQYQKLNEVYFSNDGFVFSSSCENLPNILVEGMASGLPIACSDKSVMPEVLGTAGLYYNPENVQSIANAIRQLFNDNELRDRLANLSFEKAKQYSWSRCAKQTLDFISDVALKNLRKIKQD